MMTMREFKKHKVEAKQLGELGDKVYDTLKKKEGRITKAYRKVDVKHFDDYIEVEVFYEYTVSPLVTTYNNFRSREENLLSVATDFEGNEIHVPLDQ